MGSVNDKEVDIAIENGVILVFLDKELNYRGSSPRVSVVSYRTGNVILNDREIYIRERLEICGIKILGEIKILKED